MKRLASLTVLLCLVAFMTGCCCTHCGQPASMRSCKRMMKQNCGSCSCGGFACGGAPCGETACGVGCGIDGQMSTFAPGGDMMMMPGAGGGCASGNCAGGGGIPQGMPMTNMSYEGTGWVPAGNAWSTNMTPMATPGLTPTPAQSNPSTINPATPRAN